MWKKIVLFWNETYKEELDSINKKFSINTVDARVFNNFNEDKAIKSAKNYVNSESFKAIESAKIHH